jgi:hypothetical protein
MAVLLGNPGLQKVNARAGVSGASPSIASIPLCADAPQLDTSYTAAIPEVVDDETGEIVSPADTIMYQEVMGADIDEVLSTFTWVMLPTRVPNWVGCYAVDYDASQDGEGAFWVRMYSGDSVASAATQLDFQMSFAGPQDMPPANGQFIPVPVPDFGAGVGVPEIDTVFRDVGTQLGMDIATGTRIVWTNLDGRYFEIVGAVSLDEAILMAQSVEPA